MIPIGDNQRSRSTPYVNLTIIALNFVVFFYELVLNGQEVRGVLGSATELDRFVLHWGNIPACTLDALGWDQLTARSIRCAAQPEPSLTPFSAMFMHLGWAHILGNMLFLWIFGDNVEDAMGHARYAAFYILVGLLASLAHGVTNPDSLVPAVGASGAVAGVMGAYIVLFPRANVIAIVPFLFFLPFPVPAFVIIGIWFLLELFRGFASVGPGVSQVGGGIAYFAHIGGFAAGAALVHLFVLGRPRPRTPRRARRWETS